MKHGIILGVTCSCLALLTSAARADGVLLTNGDAIHGEVVSLDKESLILKSEHLGELSLKRGVIAEIHLGDVRLDRAARNAAASSTASATESQRAESAASAPASPEELVGNLTGRTFSANNGKDSATVLDTVRQLQAGGLNPGAVAEVQKSLPLLNTPEVQEYFNSTVGGLMSGSLGVQDIRKDAVKARDMILDLKKDLGPQADALNGYLSILNGFIDETVPSTDGQGDAKAVETPRQ